MCHLISIMKGSILSFSKRICAVAKLFFATVFLASFAASASASIVGEWKIAPEQGAVGVGPTYESMGWWTNSANDVDVRSCFFDDTYTFGADGTFTHEMGDSTWIEGWQGEGITDGCGTPVAPHVGGTASYSYDATPLAENGDAGALTITGVGAHIGIPKVVNGSELSDPSTAPGSIVYNVSELTDERLTLDIFVGGGWWRFKLVNTANYTPVVSEEVSVTFQVDMTGVDTSAGVSVIGGAIFGQAGQHMSDDDNDNIWTLTTNIPVNTEVLFKYRNTNAGTWDGQESVPAECGFTEWLDRKVTTVDSDITLDVVAFNSCTADAATAPSEFYVTFSVDMNGVDISAGNPTINGTFNNWCGDCNPLTDDDGDGIWTTTLLLPAGDIEYKFTLGAWADQETVPGECALDPNAENINRAISITDADVTADVTPYGGCPADEASSFDVTGDWRLAPEAGALGVGPGLGDIGWWSNNDADVLTRLCLFDDVLSFNADGSFTQDMQDATWLEGWQGAAEGCGTPVAPHDGSNAATYEYDAAAGTLTVTGDGAHIGLSKVHNTGEDGNSGGSITYIVTELTETSMTLDINYNTDNNGHWRFKLVTADSVAAPAAPIYGCTDTNATNYDANATSDDGSCDYPEPVNNDNDQIAGVWRMAPQALAMGVGPSQGATNWWSSTEADVETRACFFDDTFNLDADGSFSNNMGDETWLEGWQGAADGCGAPIAPHDGSNPATYIYDATAGTLTVTGDGAHIGLAKARNGGEDGVSGGSITYTVTELTETTMTLDIQVGGGWWRFELVNQDWVANPPVSVTFQVDMSSVDTHPEGVYLAGGGFGQAGHLMTDNGSDVWSVTLELSQDTTYLYKFRNQPSYETWEGFEDPAGLIEGGCNTGDYDDRFVEVADADITLPVVHYGYCAGDAPEPAGSWDFDSDGNADALTDGLLLLRYAFGLTGDALVASAIAETSPLTPEQVEANVAASTTSFADIDGNGTVDALTDGLLLLRYLFGLTGDALLASAVAEDATRTSAADIEAYILSLYP